MRLRTWLQLGHAGAGVFIWGMIWLCCAIELALWAADLGLWAGPQLRGLAYQYGGFWPGLLDDWRPNYPVQPWLMFVTYSLLHGGFEHIFGNMIMLYILGRQLRAVMGQGGVMLCYVTAVLGGALGFAVLNHSPFPMVGASGAIFGLAGALLADDWNERRQSGRRLWPVLRMVLLLAVMNLVLWVWLDGRLAWEAHFGGFLAGWAAAVLVLRRQA